MLNDYYFIIYNLDNKNKITQIYKYLHFKLLMLKWFFS